MKKRMMKLMTLVLAFALVFGLTACGGEEKPVENMDQVNQELQTLRQEIADLEARIEALEQKGGLTDWSLTAEPWSSSNGATVFLNAKPENYQAGQTAVFSVRLEGVEVANVVCAWDGSYYTASADLEAADGYSYFCTLVSPDGTREMIALNTVENTSDETLVYLQSSLHVYGNLLVETWESDDKALTIKTGFVQVQMPRLGANAGLEMNKAELVFELNGQVLERRTIDIPAGEGQGSYEMALSNLSFEMPKMEDDYQLDLWLEVALSGEETLVVSGGSWFYNAGTLNMLVG